jgi:hypothetical protein
MIDSAELIEADPIADPGFVGDSHVAVLEMRHSTIAFIERARNRARCFGCDRRRILYRIAVRTVNHAVERTEARCAECWGIRTEEG